MILNRTRMTLSINEKERVRMEEVMKEYGYTQHAVVKMALDYFLFPKERDRIPVDGYVSLIEGKDEIIIKERDDLSPITNEELQTYKDKIQKLTEDLERNLKQMETLKEHTDKRFAHHVAVCNYKGETEDEKK